MSMSTTSNPADVTNRYQTVYSKSLLEQTVNLLRKQEFAQQAELPRNMGSKKVKFFRRRAGSSAEVQALTEGVAISTFTEVATENVEVTLAQVGEAFKQSDIASWTDVYNWLNQAVEVMGEDCALKCDDLLRDAIMFDATNGLINSNGKSERFCGVPYSGNSATDFTALAALGAATAKWTRLAGLTACTQLRVSKAPKVNGGYVGIIAPEVIHDALQDKDWLDAAKYSAPDKMYNGELGKIDGVRYIEDTNPARENVYGTYAAAGSIFTTIYTGKGFYGVTKLAGTNSPWKPSIVILKAPDKSDPIGQFTVASWKAYYQAVCLNKAFGVALRSKVTFV
jgi:N4-gp56 family major capsid protein